MKHETMLYRDWLNLRSHLLWCYDHRLACDRERGQVHRSRDFVNNGAWLVRSGWAQVKYGDEVTRAEPGQWLIVKPGHRVQSFATDTRLLSVAFEATWPDGTPWLQTGLPLVLEARDASKLETKAKPMVAILSGVTENQWDARRQGVDYRQFLKLERDLKDWFLVLLDILSKHGVHPQSRVDIDERVIRAMNLIDAHPLGEPIALEGIAGRAGLSQVHLSRLFQHELETTPRHYFEKRRIDHAYRRLRMPDARIKEVAIALGFAHLSHFSKWFKKHSGQSPRDFIRSS